MKIRLTDEVKHLIDRLNAAGYGAWAVGGCVRDGLIGREIHDWDVCTDASPARMESALAGERIIRTGVKHGTLTIVIAGVPIETTTLRSDGNYADHRRPDSVEFVSDIALDLARRDFTINAMAYNDREGLIDPYDGLADLKNGVIKCVGHASERFNEDALRILRAVRFASQLGFTIEPETAQAAREKRRDLSFVSRERVEAEIIKLLRGEAAWRAVVEYKDIICAALAVSDIDTDFISLPRHEAAALTLLLGRAAPGVMKALKADGAMLSRLDALCAVLDYPAIETVTDALRLLRDAKSPQAAYDLAEYRECKGTPFDGALITAAEQKCHSVAQLKINGGDLIALGFAGKAIGRVLNGLLTMVINGEIENEREQLIDNAAKAIDIE